MRLEASRKRDGGRAPRCRGRRGEAARGGAPRVKKMLYVLLLYYYYYYYYYY